MNPRLLVPIALAFAGTLAGCNLVDREYTHTRPTPAAGRKSPTTFTVRIQVDKAKRTVDWLEDVSDADGYMGRTIKTYKDCEVFDSKNWFCTANILPDKDTVTMANGTLRQIYWDEDRTYESGFRLNR